MASSRGVCAEPGCEREHKARGFSHVHYEQRRRDGLIPIAQRVAAKIEKPNSAAAFVCLTGTHAEPAAFLWWSSAAEALEADAVLLDTPCRPPCVGRHLVVVRVGEAVRVGLSRHEPTTTLEEELVACYGEHPPRRLPPPDPEYNAPLTTWADRVLVEWAQDDASVAGASRILEGQVSNALDTLMAAGARRGAGDVMTLTEAREFVRAHAETCLDPMCHRLRHALDSAHYSVALNLVREAIDPADRTTEGIPPWSEVSRAWPSAFDGDDRRN